VISKGYKKNGLFFLDAATVVGQASVVSKTQHD
jgi:hypothetical protein